MATLTAEQKIEVLRLAKKKLGPGGRNWVKRNWFAKQNELGITHPCPPEVATCFCLEGAISVAAAELGYYDKPRKSAGAAHLTSIVRFVNRTQGFRRLYEFNDQRDTTWKQIKSALDGRIKELQKETN